MSGFDRLSAVFGASTAILIGSLACGMSLLRAAEFTNNYVHCFVALKVQGRL